VGNSRDMEHHPSDEEKQSASLGKSDLDWLRPYLRLLAATGLNQQLRVKLDPSDIVQQTLFQAHRARGSFRGTTKNELLAWIKQILTRNLTKVARDFGREKRDIGREQSLEAAFQTSWLKVDQVLVLSDSSPLDRMQGNEQRLNMCAAVEQLPDSQRLAVELHHFLGWPISQIAEEMEKTPVAVSGLLKRGLRTLRIQLKSGVDSSR